MRLTRKPRSKTNEKTKEDIRFDRMRWGWIALAICSAAFYIAKTGFRVKLQIVDPDILVKEEDILEFDAEEGEEDE